MDQLPNNIMVGVADIWLGPTDEAWPDVDDTPAGNWELLGTTGNEEYSEDGVHLQFTRQHVKHFTLGSTHPKKASITREELMVSLTLLDMDPDELSKAFNHNTVSSVAAGAAAGGYDWHGLSLNLTPTEKRMLIRMAYSPLLTGGNSQFELERVYAVGDYDMAFTKDGMVGAAMEFHCLEDPDASTDAERFGRWVAQDAEPTG